MGDIIKKFTVPTYSSSTIYSKFDIVKVISSNKEYYFVSTHEGGNRNQMDANRLSNAFWKRFDDVDVDFSTVWMSSYGTSVEITPRVVNATFDEGVTQISRDGINVNALKFQLTFENINDKEALSLMAFFDFMGSKRSFKWTAPEPYGKILSFNMVGFRHVFTKKNINSVSLNLEQSFVIYGVGAGQQSFGSFET